MCNTNAPLFFWITVIWNARRTIPLRLMVQRYEADMKCSSLKLLTSPTVTVFALPPSPSQILMMMMMTMTMIMDLYAIPVNYLNHAKGCGCILFGVSV
jgi:hypothetical protein